MREDGRQEAEFRRQNTGGRIQGAEDGMKERAKTFEDLIVWQKAHQLVLAVYRISQAFPRSEIYGLSSQFRRAAVSIAANIAEGFRKQGKADKLRYYNIAQASLEECRYYLILIHDLGYADSGDMMMQVEEVSKLLQAYCRSVKNAEC